MNSTLNSSLPPEILDHIFTLIGADSAALTACSQVNPAFSKLAERHLYAHIDVYTRKQPQKYSLSITPSHLAQLLQKSPHIANYIRSSTVIVSNSNAAIQLLFKWASRRNDENEEILGSLFPQLSRLHTVKLTQGAGGTLPWTDLHHQLRSAFIQHLQSSSITELHLYGINDFPLLDLTCCPSLKRLKFAHIYRVHYAGAEDVNDTHPTTLLDTLSIYRCVSGIPDIINWAKSPPSSSIISGLLSLNFRIMTHAHMGYVADALKGCCKTLKFLEFDCGENCGSLVLLLVLPIS